MISLYHAKSNFDELLRVTEKVNVLASVFFRNGILIGSLSLGVLYANP